MSAITAASTRTRKIYAAACARSMTPCSKVRRAGDALDADEGASPRGTLPLRDADEYRALRCHGASRAQRSLRHVRRTADRLDADRASFRRRDAAAGRVRLRAE